MKKDQTNANTKRDQTAEEVKEEILRVFPKGTGRLFYELLNDVSYLHLNWKNYRSLYGTSPERIDLLNWAAPLFFALLDGILRHDIILAIARITDPAKTGKHQNASLENLLKKLMPSLESTQAHQLHRELKKLRDHCKRIRDIRDQIIAHNDLATALQYRPAPLPGISRAHIESVLAKIQKFIGDIEELFRDTRTSYFHIFSIGNAESLISSLENASEYKRRSRCKSKKQ